jgi:hypothetical protein|tara:strand:+ start:479 stop:634 length:156 start_codon:yes stop_codon:yes gene_type:complete
MPKKKQLTQIDKMRLKLKQEKIQKDQNTFLKKEKVYYELPIIKKEKKELEE